MNRPQGHSKIMMAFCWGTFLFSLLAPRLFSSISTFQLRANNMFFLFSKLCSNLQYGSSKFPQGPKVKCLQFFPPFHHDLTYQIFSKRATFLITLCVYLTCLLPCTTANSNFFWWACRRWVMTFTDVLALLTYEKVIGEGGLYFDHIWVIIQSLTSVYLNKQFFACGFTIEAHL